MAHSLLAATDVVPLLYSDAVIKGNIDCALDGYTAILQQKPLPAL